MSGKDFVVAEKALEEEIALYKQKIKDQKKYAKGTPSDVHKMYLKTIKTYKDFIDNLGVALFCLRQRQALRKWLQNLILDPKTDKQSRLVLQAVLDYLNNFCDTKNYKKIFGWLESKEKEVKQG